MAGSTFLVGIWAGAPISVAREAYCLREHFLEGSKSDRGSDRVMGMSRPVGSSGFLALSGAVPLRRGMLVVKLDGAMLELVLEFRLSLCPQFADRQALLAGPREAV